MIRLAAVLSALLGAVALGDEVPNDACRGQLGVGDACLTDNGAPGVCVVREGDLICVPTVSQEQRSALPWLGAGLAFLALCAGVASSVHPERSRRKVESPP